MKKSDNIVQVNLVNLGADAMREEISKETRAVLSLEVSEVYVFVGQTYQGMLLYILYTYILEKSSISTVH